MAWGWPWNSDACRGAESRGHDRKSWSYREKNGQVPYGALHACMDFLLPERLDAERLPMMLMADSHALDVFVFFYGLAWFGRDVRSRVGCRSEVHQVQLGKKCEFSPLLQMYRVD